MLPAQFIQDRHSKADNATTIILFLKALTIVHVEVTRRFTTLACAALIWRIR